MRSGADQIVSVLKHPDWQPPGAIFGRKLFLIWLHRNANQSGEHVLEAPWSASCCPALGIFMDLSL